MFEGFEQAMVDTGEATLNVRWAGSGPPLLLLHGHPQTHVMWHRVAPRLAEDFTVIVPDLRGYGESSRPISTPDHEPYSKRAMARDQLVLMRHFGFDRFAIAGHDRGGRVAYRLALDHPDSVRRLAVLDIIPTSEALRRADMAFGMDYWHWFFLAQPYPLPERLLAADPDAYYLARLDAPWRDREALANYMRFVRDPEVSHAMCEDYRAGVSYDYQLDEADRGRRRISCPLLALWARTGSLEKWYDVPAIWRDWADDVQGKALDSGHFMPEEAPDATYEELHTFFVGQ